MARGVKCGSRQEGVVKGEVLVTEEVLFLVGVGEVFGTSVEVL